MKLEISSEELIELLEGRLAVGMTGERSGPVLTDTRKSVKDSWFIALCGPKFDGHDFIGEAYSKGAVGCIVKERTGYPIAETNFPLIAVEDTLIAFGRLAGHWLSRIGVKVILVVSEDRDQSSQFASKLKRELAVKAELIDTRLMRLEHCFEKALEADDELDVFIVNLVPSNLEEVQLIVDTFAPDYLLVIGEPFEYLRLFESKSEIESTTHFLYELIDHPGGTVFYSGRGVIPKALSKLEKARLESSPETNAVPKLFSPDSSSESIDMSPGQDISVSSPDWIIAKLAEEFKRAQKSE